MEDRMGHSSQWDGLRTIWIVITQEHGPLTICTWSWADFHGLTLWRPQWKQ